MSFPRDRLKIAPSILSADFAHLADEVKRVESESDWIHVDIMDGRFVPNITIGPPVVASLRPHTSLPLDCHLMIVEPGNYYEAFAKAGADSVTFHREATDDPEREIAAARGLGLGVGMAISPETPFAEAVEVLDQLDILLVMSVHPGFGGQSFISDVLEKVEKARQLVNDRGLDVDIEIDGGIGVETGCRSVAAGANVLVAGSAVFDTEDPASAAAAIREAAERQL